MNVIGLVVALLMAVSILLIPLGLLGLWVLVGVGALAGQVPVFLGAALVTYHELRDMVAARRVGWGVLLARTLSVGLKVAAAVVIFVIGGTAWVLR